MGFLDGVVNTIRNPGRAIRGTVRGADRAARNVSRNRAFRSIFPVVGGLLGDDNKPASPPPIDRHLSRIRSQQVKDLRQFENDLPRIGQDLYRGVETAENNRLAEQERDIHKDANRRGLLYSNIRQGNEAKARSQSAQSLVGARTDINTQLQDQARQMREDAIGSGLDIQTARQSIQDQIYNQALANMASRRGLLGGLFGTAGTVAGSAAGSGT